MALVTANPSAVHIEQKLLQLKKLTIKIIEHPISQKLKPLGHTFKGSYGFHVHIAIKHIILLKSSFS